MIARLRKRASERNERASYVPICVLVVSGSCGGVGGCACSRWKEKKGDIDRDKIKEYRHQNEYIIQKIKGNSSYIFLLLSYKHIM